VTPSRRSTASRSGCQPTEILSQITTSSFDDVDVIGAEISRTAARTDLRPAHSSHVHFLDHARQACRGLWLAGPGVAWRQDERDVATRSSVELRQLRLNDVVSKGDNELSNTISLVCLHARLSQSSSRGKRLLLLILYKYTQALIFGSYEAR